MLSSREGVCGNNAVQFQSCDGSSYCTALGENDCTDIVFHQLRDSSMVRRWCGQFTEGRTNHDEDRSGRPSLLTTELMESVRKADLQNRCLKNSKLSGKFPRCLPHCCTKSSPGDRKTFLPGRWGTDSSEFMVPDVDGRLLRHKHRNIGVAVR